MFYVGPICDVATVVEIMAVVKFRVAVDSLKIFKEISHAKFGLHAVPNHRQNYTNKVQNATLKMAIRGLSGPSSCPKIYFLSDFVSAEYSPYQQIVFRNIVEKKLVDHPTFS